MTTTSDFKPTRKAFINALCRRLLRDDLSAADRERVGRLVRELQQAEKEDAAQRGGAKMTLHDDHQAGDRHAQE
jgi:hypothetical protein